ncbi:MAG: GntR family transcriptional regulator [Oscillospiraceae bacterium]|nr:GntR family transcriptional regulator [Oscillospiraceae bacterium]
MDWILNDGRPIWLQIKEQIAIGIITGKYPSGSRLPSVRELAVDAGVNPNTMQRALTELERDGLAQSMGTVGRIVTENQDKISELRKMFARDVVKQYLNGMERLGFTASEAYEVLGEWIHE